MAPSPVPLAVGAAVADDAGSLAADHHEGHVGPPHESPWMMTVPLMVLAVLAIFGGLLNLPFGNLDFLHQWLEAVPFIEATELVSTTSTGVEAILVTCSILAALLGIFLGWLVYQQAPPEGARAGDPGPRLVRRRRGVAWAVANPGTESWEDVLWVDENIIDGAVMGTGSLATQVGRGLRRYQTGYVRGYAVGIGIGAVLLLGWFLLAGVL